MSKASQTAHTSSLRAGALWMGKGGGTIDDDKSLDNVSEVTEKLKRAIIVEDEMYVALHLETVLEDLGLEVCEIVATGRDALAEAIISQPDIIFMDINLRGEIDGIEAARLIREKFEIPIIFVTAYGDTATLKRANAVAPDAPVLQKPPMTTALAAAIAKVLGS